MSATIVAVGVLIAGVIVAIATDPWAGAAIVSFDIVGVVGVFFIGGRREESFASNGGDQSGHS